MRRRYGGIVRFARGDRYRAGEWLREWISGGADGAMALFLHCLPEPPQALHEAWARAWLVTVPRHAALHVPTAAELLAQMPTLGFLPRA